jgi:hypothetical protein
MIGQQLRNTPDVTLVNQTAAARAGMTLVLGIYVAEIMATTRPIGFKPIGRFAKTLGRRLVGFQLRHDQLHLVKAKAHKATCCHAARLLADQGFGSAGFEFRSAFALITSFWVRIP